MQGEVIVSIIGIAASSVGLVGFVIKWTMNKINDKDEYIRDLVANHEITVEDRRQEINTLHNKHYEVIKGLTDKYALTVNNHINHETQVLEKISDNFEMLKDQQVNMSSVLHKATETLGQSNEVIKYSKEAIEKLARKNGISPGATG